MILEQVAPAYRALHRFFVDEYLPAARASIAASDLPDGADVLRAARALVHDARPHSRPGARDRPRRGGAHRSGDGAGPPRDRRRRKPPPATRAAPPAPRTVRELIESLRTDRRFYTADPDDLLRRAAWVAKRADGKLPRLFRTLPRVPYTVEPVPAHMAPKYTSARYVPPPYGGVEPGIYWVNIYRPETRPLFNLTALTLHEAVPGHHLQGSLANELDEPAAVSPLRLHRRLRRGLGPLCRVAGHRDGDVRRPLERLRPARLRDVAGLPPGGRHRDARQGLDPRARDRVHGGAHLAAAARSARPRSTATSRGRARRSPTRWARSSCASSGAEPRRRWARASTCASSTTRCCRTAA